MGLHGAGARAAPFVSSPSLLRMRAISRSLRKPLSVLRPRSTLQLISSSITLNRLGCWSLSAWFRLRCLHASQDETNPSV